MHKSHWKPVLAGVVVCLVAWGGDAIAATEAFYSVGTSVADLKNGSPTVTISSGVATLSTAQPLNVGVGDELTYNGGTRAYVTSRTSSTVYSVSTATGTMPLDIAGATVDSITRAFNTLNAAITGASDINHLNTSDLVSNDFQLNLSCYDDAPMNDVLTAFRGVYVTGWTTDASRYVRMFTPVTPAEVGVSQRHTGVAGTGFRLVPVQAAPGLVFYAIDVGIEHLRIEGIEIDGTGITGGETINGINVSGIVTAGSDLRFDSLIIHDFTNSTVDDSDPSYSKGISIQKGNLRLSNSIIYAIHSVSTHGASSPMGVEFNESAAATHFVHNVTVLDIKHTASGGAEADGIPDWYGRATVRNTFVGDVNSVTGPEFCYRLIGTQSNNVSSDATATGATGRTSYATYFKNVTPGSEDLHLLADSVSLWTISGADLDTDPNLPVVVDIDRELRHTTTPDIGADELDVIAVYYSVGVSVADLKSGSPNVTFVNGVAAFTTAQADNVGVGDEVTYNGGTVAYISGRSSATLYTMTTATGAMPPDIAGVTVNSIRRAFNSLSAATQQSDDPAYLNTADLVAGNFQLNWPCYDDGPDPSSYVRIEEPWITGPSHYIRAYTPIDASEVGVSQRHTGIAGSGYRIVPSGAAGIDYYNFILVSTDTGYVRIEGLEIDGSNLTNGENVRGLTASDSNNSQDVWFTHNLIHDLTNTTIDDTDESRVLGIFLDDTDDSKVANNIIYNLTSVSANVQGGARGIEGNDAGKTHYIYNNTIHNLRATATTETSRGIYDASTSTMLVHNNYVGFVDSTSGGELGYSGPFAAVSNNVSADATAAGAGSQTGKSAYASYFVSVTPGSEDFHLLASSNTLWGSNGLDLDSDSNLPLTNDSDGDARHPLTPDIGADEALASAGLRDVYYSVGGSVADLKTGSPTIAISNGTATLSVAQTANIGVGDEIDYGAGLKAYIHALISQTVFSVRDATGMIPANSGAVAVNSIGRTFNTLSAAESGSSGGSYLGTSDLVTAHVRLTWVAYNDGAFTEALEIDGYTTDASHYITLTAAGSAQVASGISQRHAGITGTGAIVQPPAGAAYAVFVADPHTFVEWLDLDGTTVTATGSDGVEVGTGGNNATLLNLLIHDWDEASDDGISVDEDNVTIRNSFLYTNQGSIYVVGDNSIIQNVTIYNGGYGLLLNASSGHTVENVVSMSSAPDFSGPGGVIASNNNMSSDDTADDFVGSGHLLNRVTANQFVNIAGPIDLHLKSGSDAFENGKNLSGAFISDIDGQARPLGVQWDIGADEGFSFSYHRSVGVNGSDLNTGSRTVQISGYTATFSGAMPNNIGVGDALQYQVAATYYLAFIESRASSSVYRVTSSTSGPPQPAVAGTAVEVFRAYTSLANWAIQDENDSFDNTVEDFDTSTDLAIVNTAMSVACYADGPDSPVTIDSWTTSANGYIRIYTPVRTSEVGVSQRHDGVWDTSKYHIVSVGGTVLEIKESYVRVDGLQLYLSADTANSQGVGINGNLVPPLGTSYYEVSNSIIRGSTGATNDRNGVNLWNAGSGVLNVWNNIIYDWAGGAAPQAGILSDDSSFTYYVYNNTVTDSRRGIHNQQGTLVAKNNLVYNNVDNYVAPFAPASTNNLSGPGADGDIPPTNARNGVVVTFVNAGADDFHLAVGDGGAQDFGANLSADPNLAFTDDVDGGLRVVTWDIGADDRLAVGPVRDVYYSVGTSGADLKTGSPTIAITAGTATLSVAQTGNVGVGDVITFGGTDVYIHSVTSQTELDVRTVLGTLPADTVATGVTSIRRTFNDMSNALNDPATGPFLGTADLVSGNFSLTLVAYNDGPINQSTDRILNLYTTDANHRITLTAAGSNQVASGVSQRHNGTAGTGARMVATGNFTTMLLIQDDYVTVQWLEIHGVGDGGRRVNTGVHVSGPLEGVVIRDLLVHDIHSLGWTSGIEIFRCGSVDGCNVYNNMVYDIGSNGPSTSKLEPAFGIVDTHNAGGLDLNILNNTVYFIRQRATNPANSAAYGIAVFDAVNRTVQNNIVLTVGVTALGASQDYCIYTGSVPGGETCHSPPTAPVFATFDYNMSSDTSATGGNSVINETTGEFISAVNNAEDLHLAPSANAIDAGLDLASVVGHDIDQGARTTPFDLGADDRLATTAVDLIGFTAVALDGAAALNWETGSELDNLGFHLYRSLSAEGPYERITPKVIPGLGNSPAGARYSYRDEGLANETTYYYKLEDIETTGATKMHGPVAATPYAGAILSHEPSDGEPVEGSRITYGDPSANGLRVMKRGANFVILELITEGFYALPQEDGSVAIEVPGFDVIGRAETPSIPVKHHWVDALAGRKVALQSVRGRMEAVTGAWRVSSELPELVASPSGTVNARTRRRMNVHAKGLFPSQASRIVTVAFQGESKKALLEMAPLRWVADTGELYLARRLVVRLAFEGVDTSELSLDGKRGRKRAKRFEKQHGVLARLATSERGLYGIRYEDLFGAGGSLPVGSLRLSRQGEDVAFHVESASHRFTPGSMLYFVSAGAEANAYDTKAVYELQLADRRHPGTRMRVVEAPPWGQQTPYYWKRDEHEVNRYYQAALLDAPDLWLWDLLLAPVTKSYPFEVSSLVNAVEPGQVSVWLQGTSDMPAVDDHHVRMYVNGILLAETSWNGKTAVQLDAELASGILVEGTNTLELENVGDTEASYSTLMLDRFSVRYPRQLVAEAGTLEGSFTHGGRATIVGVSEGVHVLDTSATPRWLTVGSSFAVEAGRSYLVVDPTAVRAAELLRPSATSLTRATNRADYLVIGPRAFVEAAEPLLVHRAEQGLVSKGVAIEDVFSEFGHGESSPDALRAFLEFAYHEWKAPSVRYVVLLGDGSYDYKDYTQLGATNPVPPLMVKTSYLWTASDPTLAAVNGEDLLPDIAIGRLPAASVEDVHTMVEKILAFESRAYAMDGSAVFVTDNPDVAGNFVADAEAAARRLPAGTTIDWIHLSELGASETKARVLDAFDNGVSLMSYTGHGGIHLWADENFFNTGALSSLALQPRQPILLTMNCLNGYFHFPYFGSLAEELVKADDKGAIAAFSPSGLSLNIPAQRFHKAMLDELYSGRHLRLGDVVLGAQETYLGTGAFPELLSIYHLFGDPALMLR